MSLTNSESRRVGDRAAFPLTTIGQLLLDTATQFPDRVALVQGTSDHRQRWTFPQFYHQACEVTRVLGEVCAPGDRLAICGVNSAEWVLVEYGARLAGLVVAGINPALTPTEARYLLERSDTRAIACAARHRDSGLLATYTRLQHDLPNLRRVLELDTAWSWTTTRPKHPLPQVAPSNTALIQYTSGTAGTPKGATLTHTALTLNSKLMVQGLQLEPFTTWLNILPMHNIRPSEQHEAIQIGDDPCLTTRLQASRLCGTATT